MRRPVNAVGGLTLLVVPGFWLACSAADHLDYVARSLDKWGTVTISGATLIEPDPRFQLDLELSGREIFDRNRLEGFSNILQQDSMDVQISARAEIIANMLNQMSRAEDPKIVQLLRSQLEAASFDSLIDLLPEDQRAAIRALMQPAERSIKGTISALLPGNRGGAGGINGGDTQIAASDGGTGAVAQANTALEKAKALVKAARQTYAEADANSNSDLKLSGKQAANKTARDSMDQSLKAIQSAEDAAKQADQLSAEAQFRAARLPADMRSRVDAQATNVKSAVEAVMTSAAPMRKATESAIAAWSDAADANTSISAASGLLDASSNGAISDVIQKAEKASHEAQVAIGMTGGVAASPQTPQKILEAAPIDPDRLLARNRLVSDKFREGLKNPTDPLSLNLRQLLLLTASDHMTLEMLRWLSYPRDTSPNKKVYLCMASVNVVPGRTTYKGYNAQVDLFMELGRLDAKGSLQVHRPSVEPTIFSIFPFIDSQVLDLRTSRRQAFSLAVQLAISGYPAAANILLDYARQREQDAATITGVNTITSYGNGRHVGFTFSPRFQAQADPTSINTAPEMMLQPQTFPVMLLVTFDDTMHQVFAGSSNPGKLHKYSINPETPAPTHLVCYQTHRWMRAGDPSSDAWPFGRAISELLTDRLSENEFVDRAIHTEQARDLLEASQREKMKKNKSKNNGSWRYPKAADYVDRTLQARMHYLGTLGTASMTTVPLPHFRPSANECSWTAVVHPTTAWIDAPSTIFIESLGGAVFDRGVAVSVGGRAVTAVRLSDTVLKLSMPAWIEVIGAGGLPKDRPDLLQAEVVVTNGHHVVSAGSIQFRYYSPTAGDVYPAEVTAQIVGKNQVIVADKDDGERHVVLALRRSIPAESAVIRIPTDEDRKNWLELEAVMRDTGIVSSITEIKLEMVDQAGGSAKQPKWTPEGASAIHGRTITSIELDLKLKSGAMLKIPVSGSLTVKKAG